MAIVHPQYIARGSPMTTYVLGIPVCDQQQDYPQEEPRVSSHAELQYSFHLHVRL